LAGVLVSLFGGFLLPWFCEVVGAGVALGIRHHWGIAHTMALLAIITPIWSIGAAIVLIIVFKVIPGAQFFLPVLIWLVSLMLVPPIFSRLVTVAGRQHVR